MDHWIVFVVVSYCYVASRVQHWGWCGCVGGVWGVAAMDNDLEGFHSRGLGVWWMIVIDRFYDRILGGLGVWWMIVLIDFMRGFQLNCLPS